MRRPRQSTAKAKKAEPNDEPPRLPEHIRRLLDDANDSSNAARNAWLAFLALVAYLLVTLAGISHKDLLLNSGVELPIINVNIPLFSFFQYAPLLLLLVMLSLLIQHVMLARKYHKFVEALAPYETKQRREHPARELVHPYVVAQLLAGPKRNLVTSLLMRVMAFVTFALLPILTLLYFQVKFIPYHEVWITYLHRIVVIIGLGLLFTLLPIIQLKPRKGGIEIGPRDEVWRAAPLGIVLATVTGALVIGFSWLVATVPDERLDRAIGFVSPTDQRDLLAHPRSHYEKLLLNPLVRSAYERFHEAQNDDERGWLLQALVSYRVLVVEDMDMVPDDRVNRGETSVALRGRNFRFAKLNRSDLHLADLTGSDLRGAELWGTRLEKAELQDAVLEGADLTSAQLQGANLTRARLRGATLTFAELQGANLHKAKLQNASLHGIKLLGAELQEAELQNAILSSAYLQGANFALAQLQNSSLEYSLAQGVTLRGANLSGAMLRFTQLQGADLIATELQAADLEDAGIWLVRFPPGLSGQSPAPLGLAQLNLSAISAGDKVILIDSLRKVADENLREKLMQKLDLILQDEQPFWWRSHEERWRRYADETTETPPDALALFLVELVCDNPAEPMGNGLIDRVRYWEGEENRRQYAESLAAALRNKTCETPISNAH